MKKKEIDPIVAHSSKALLPSPGSPGIRTARVLRA